MAYEEKDTFRLSGRLEMCLVADQMRDAEDPDEVDRLLRRQSEEVAVEHLARQMGFRRPSLLPRDADGALRFALPMIDDLLDPWPPASDSKRIELICEHALRSMTDVEAYEMLLAGPPAWAAKEIEAQTVSELGSELHRIARRSFAAALRDVLVRWERWDVPALAKQWRANRRPLPRTGPPEGATPRRQRTAQEREDARRDREAMSFTARGYTGDPLP